MVSEALILIAMQWTPTLWKLE